MMAAADFQGRQFDWSGLVNLMDLLIGRRQSRIASRVCFLGCILPKQL